jgi:GT2 family glycosyltransferase
MSAPRLTILIVNYNAWTDVTRLVETLAGSQEVHTSRCEIVVVDNASDDPPPREFLGGGADPRLVQHFRNEGFAAGVNAGWRASRGDWLLLLNPDIETDSGLPGRVLERIAAHSDRPEGPPGILGFGLRNPDGSHQPSVGAEPRLFRTLIEAFLPRASRKYRSSRKTRAGEVPWVTGACALVDRRVLEAVGGMDEEFFLYYEEVAFAQSARQRGFRVEFDPSIEVVHLRPLQNRPVPAWMRVITRHSKLLYFQKHRPRIEFDLLGRVVSVEARIRALGSRRAGAHESAEAWDVIANLAGRMRHGERIVGRDIYELARALASGPGAQSTGTLRPRISPGLAGTRRRKLTSADVIDL